MAEASAKEAGAPAASDAAPETAAAAATAAGTATAPPPVAPSGDGTPPAAQAAAGGNRPAPAGPGKGSGPGRSSRGPPLERDPVTRSRIRVLGGVLLITALLVGGPLTFEIVRDAEGLLGNARGGTLIVNWPNQQPANATLHDAHGRLLSNHTLLHGQNALEPPLALVELRIAANGRVDHVEVYVPERARVELDGDTLGEHTGRAGPPLPLAQLWAWAALVVAQALGSIAMLALRWRVVGLAGCVAAVVLAAIITRSGALLMSIPLAVMGVWGFVLLRRGRLWFERPAALPQAPPAPPGAP